MTKPDSNTDTSLVIVYKNSYDIGVGVNSPHPPNSLAFNNEGEILL